MAAGLSIEDVIDKDFYVDRHGTSHPNKIDDKSIYFLNRVEDLFLDVVHEHYSYNVDNKGFIEAYSPIAELVLQLPRDVSKDSFRKNWIINIRGGVVAIDFGTLRWLPPQLELVNLLEGCRDTLSDNEIKRLIMEYISIRTKNGNKAILEDSFMEGYFSCAVQRHLELVGYNELGYLDPPFGVPDRSSENIWQINKARENLKKVIGYQPRLRLNSDYIGYTLMEIENKILKGLNI